MGIIGTRRESDFSLDVIMGYAFTLAAKWDDFVSAITLQLRDFFGAAISLIVDNVLAFPLASGELTPRAGRTCLGQ
jgi:hypothetical protein